MGSVHNFKGVELTANQLKRIEKVFIAAAVPYFTHGVLSWANVTRISQSKNTGKYVVNAGELINHIRDSGLTQAIKDEFAGVDLREWVRTHQVDQRTILKPKE